MFKELIGMLKGLFTKEKKPKASQLTKNVIARLRELQHGVDCVESMGICASVDGILAGDRYGEENQLIGGCSIVRKYSKGWDKFSGVSSYPVPVPGHNDPEKYYYDNHLWEGDYGKLRMELAGFIADKLEKEFA